MTDIQLVQGAATLLVDKLIGDTNAEIASISIGLQRKGSGDHYRFYKVSVEEIDNPNESAKSDDGR